MRPRYSLPEFERRWLVPAAAGSALCGRTFSRIRDRYLDDTRLRLRRVQATDGSVVYKLCRKYGDRPAGGESITNLYLTDREFELLDALPGWVVEKRRHALTCGSLDCYPAGVDTLFVFEREFADADAMARAEDPEFAERDVTTEAAFSGAALARRFGQHQG